MEAQDRSFLAERSVEYLRRLVSIPSPSGDEAEIGYYVASVLKGLGLDVTMQPVGRRFNVIARTPATQEVAGVLLTGHLDTVPVMAGWETDPFSVHIVGDRLYGLGAADQKGGIAATLAALEAMGKDGTLAGANILVAFTPDEEALSDGMLTFLATRPRVRVAILSEPHFSPATIGWPGKALLKAVVHGRAAHGGRPWQGVNAIEEAAVMLLALQKAVVAEHPDLGAHPFVTLSIKGGYERYSLTVPDRCEVVLSKQLVPGESKESVLALAEKAASEMKSGRAEFAFDRPYYPPGAQDPAHPEIQRLAAAYQKVTGQPLVLGFGRGVCDGDYLAEAGIPTVSFGPSGGSTHQANEWVSIEQLGAAAEVYLRICLEG